MGLGSSSSLPGMPGALVGTAGRKQGNSTLGGLSGRSLCAPLHGGSEVTVKAEATRPPSGQAGSGTLLLPPYFIDEGKSQS